jgi:3-dehydroquinate synthase
MKTLKLKVSKNEVSEIIISTNINLHNFITKIHHDKKLLITDEKIFTIFKERIRNLHTLLIKSDREKKLSDVERIIDYLIKNNFSRRSLLIAFGGGKITDTVGFVASIYMRGINWIDIPTTALSQIDASVGGKTAIDFKGIKNIIGSFHLPRFTIIDPTYTQSQDDFNFHETIGELVKYLLIMPKEKREKLENLMERMHKRDIDAIHQAIGICVGFKIDIVKKDPFDEKGIREILNLGHTPAHAIEEINKIPHGYAVWYGLYYITKLSEKLGVLKNKDIMNLFIENYKLDENLIIKKDPKKFLKLILADKKRKGYRNYFLLIENFSRIKPVFNIDEKIILDTYLNL